MLNRLAQIDSIWALVEHMLGWLPCVQLQRVSARTVLAEESRRLLQQQLARLQLRLPPAARLPPSILIQLLHAMAITPILRLDDPTLRGSHWRGHVFPPRGELRVAVRYLPQNPRRAWSILDGRPVRLEQVEHFVNNPAWATAVTLLRVHGFNLRRHCEVTRRLRDHGEDFECFRISIMTVHCTVLGFEVMIRITMAREMDPAQSPTSSESS